MKPLIRSPRPEQAVARPSPRFFRGAALAVVLGTQWVAFDSSAQVLPLAFDQNAFLYKTYPVYTTNTPPGINWQSRRGVPISTNYSADTGSDGRAPTTSQQRSYGLTTASPSPGQFSGFVGFAAVPVQGATNLNTNVS